MLKEIHCVKFSETPIVFGESLNVVLGDNVATNSIGKSTLLMVIDFVMGGDSFLKHNIDVINELGHHVYYFKFEFNNVIYAFSRSTSRHDIIHKCDNDYNERESISIEEFREELMNLYGLISNDLTFRGYVSLSSRIWGKPNLNVKKPLHLVEEEKVIDVLNRILKLYGRFSYIKNLIEEESEIQSEYSLLSKAIKKELLPKINKKKYQDNKEVISNNTSEINDIKERLAVYATNIREIVNRNILSLKVRKDKLLVEQNNVDSRILRISNFIDNNKHIKSKKFHLLKKYFSNINEERIVKVEEFHSKITTILKNELIENRNSLLNEKLKIDSEIKSIDSNIAHELSNVENPNLIVDRIYDLSTSTEKAKNDNYFFDKEAELQDKAKRLKSDLKEERIKKLIEIETIINKTLNEFHSKIYGQTRKTPHLKFDENKYNYDIYEDTGTGKAYSNLILLDFSLFSTTTIPFIIHDSLLFKNIENEAVAKIIELYCIFNKQSFIAIDEAQKYGIEVENKLSKLSVIQLSKDKVLYIKNWKK